MNFLFDVVILGIMVFTVYRYVSRGFVKSVMKLASVLIALALAYSCSAPLAKVYNDKIFAENFSNSVEKKISPVIEKTEDTFNLQKLFEDMPDSFKNVLKKFDVDENSLADTFGKSEKASEETVKKLSSAIAAPLADLVSKALAFLTVFVVALVLLLVATWIIDLIFKLPLLKGVNKIMGFLLGILCAFIYAYVFSKVGVVLIDVGAAFNSKIFNDTIINNSLLLKFFSNLNLLELF